MIIGPLDIGTYYYKVDNGKEMKVSINVSSLEDDLYRRYLRKIEVIKIENR